MPDRSLADIKVFDFQKAMDKVNVYGLSTAALALAVYEFLYNEKFFNNKKIEEMERIA